MSAKGQYKRCLDQNCVAQMSVDQLIWKEMCLPKLCRPNVCRSNDKAVYVSTKIVSVKCLPMVRHDNRFVDETLRRPNCFRPNNATPTFYPKYLLCTLRKDEASGSALIRNGPGIGSIRLFTATMNVSYSITTNVLIRLQISSLLRPGNT
jgi:hypothetical protein